MYLNYPSNPCAVAAPQGVFADAVRFAAETGAAVVHDFAYGDLVFDGRRAESFLATEHAKDFGVEMFSMSKTYGMAGWRLGFVVGNAEIVERIDLLQDHARAGIFVAVQEAGIAALTARRSRSRRGVTPTSDGAIACSRRWPRPPCRHPSARERSTSGFGFPRA